MRFNGTKAGLLSQVGDEPNSFGTSWDDTDSVDIKDVLSDDVILSDVYENPRYMITLLASRWPTGSEENFSSRFSYSGNRVPKLYIFRITARGRGGSDSGQVVLRSTYAMLVN